MQLRHINKIVKERTHKGNKNSRTHYRIVKTEQYKTIVGNRKFKLSVRDINTVGLDRDLLNSIKEQWLKAGYNLKDFNRIGTVKALQLLNK